MERYNLAFIPKFRSQEFITLATMYSDLHHNYFLGNNSIPHVTVCQFYFEENNLELLYEKIYAQLSKYSIELQFTKLSNITFKENIYWLSLLPDNIERLENIFNQASTFLSPLREEAYEPHLTLFNYISKNYKPIQFPNNQIDIADQFELVIGKSDSVGQLIKVLKIFP